MDYFGINSPDDLPKISEVMMEELVNATNVIEAQQEMADHNAANQIDTATAPEEVMIEEVVVIDVEEEIPSADTNAATQA